METTSLMVQLTRSFTGVLKNPKSFPIAICNVPKKKKKNQVAKFFKHICKDQGHCLCATQKAGEKLLGAKDTLLSIPTFTYLCICWKSTCDFCAVPRACCCWVAPIAGRRWRTICCSEEPVVFILAQHPPSSSWKRKPASSCPSPCQHASSSVESNPTPPYSPSQRTVAWYHIWPWVVKLTFDFTSIKVFNQKRKIITAIITVYRL